MNLQLSNNSVQRGFTLNEVLVSVFIFSVGLLGLAELQVVSKQSNYEAVQRVTAAYLARDVVTRMRANPTALQSYVTVSGTNIVGRGTLGDEPTPVCSNASLCTEAQLALHDMWEWEQLVDGANESTAAGGNAGGLVSPTACVAGPATGDAGIYTVAVVWRGKNALSNPQTNACGDQTGLYGANNEYRRLLLVETYIDNQF